MEWISVKDKLPDNEEEVIALTIEQGEYCAYKASWDGRTWNEYPHPVDGVVLWTPIIYPPTP